MSSDETKLPQGFVVGVPSHSHSICLPGKSTATSYAQCLSNFVQGDFFTVALQLCMVDGEVLCSDAVAILLDVNNAKKRQQLSFFLSTSAWKITKPHTNTNSTKQKLFKRKVKCENSK